MDVAVHNHPRSNPPSINDLLTLAKMNERSNGKFESSFIVPKTGPIYVLQVTDKDKAYNFYELYKNKTSELETKRTEYLAWLISNGGERFRKRNSTAIAWLPYYRKWIAEYPCSRSKAIAEALSKWKLP